MLVDRMHSCAPLDGAALLGELEGALERTLGDSDDPADVLHRAMRYAVLGGGKRLRPRLLLVVAAGSEGSPLDPDRAELALRAAIAVELVHAASLVHDDLPCFDDAELRRSRPSVHRKFGEPMALLAGDGLITAAFEILAAYEGPLVTEALRLGRLLAEATGVREGIIGGQAMELVDPRGDTWPREKVGRYHERKTAALFRYSARAGALVVGRPLDEQVRWGEVGARIGQAFQLIDDLLELCGTEAENGKTTGQDRRLLRPNHALRFGSRPTYVELCRRIDELHERILELARKPKVVLEVLAGFDSFLDQIDVALTREEGIPWPGGTEQAG